MLMHSIMDPTVGTFAGSIVELTDVLTLDIHIPTEHLLATEDIPPASDNILVRFTVGITRPAQTIPLLNGRGATVARMSEATGGFSPQAWTDHVARLDGLCECEAAPRDDAPAFAMGWPLHARYSRISLRAIRATCSLGVWYSYYSYRHRYR